MDQLDNFVVKHVPDQVAAPLHHVINSSLMQHKFPSSWKLTKIVPLHNFTVKERKLQASCYLVNTQ